MISDFDLSKLKISWTKYDIVQVMDVIYDKKTLELFLNREASINPSVLCAFLGVNSLNDPIPNLWYEILNYPEEKKLFALFSVIFTHARVIEKFANVYSKGNMKGVYIYEQDKMYTNIRSALIESGAAEIHLRRSKKVPYDFSPIFTSPNVGSLFKKLLISRISNLLNRELVNDSEFYQICFDNNFHKAISLNESQFKTWLEGQRSILLAEEPTYIDKVIILNFHSIQSMKIEMNGSKEVYFLGENGDGKSLILMALYLTFNRHYVKSETDKERTGRVLDILDKKSEMILIGKDSHGRDYTKRYGAHLENFFAYGTYRGRFSTDDAEKYGFMSLFNNNEELINPVSFLKNLKLEELNSEGEQILENSIFTIESLRQVFFSLLEKNVDISIVGDKVVFIEKGSSSGFEELSEGYKSIIVFVCDLFFRLQSKQPKVREISEFTGVVIVDEIELHLHPKWARSLVGKLRQILPGVQFIFTTHSPNIIQGAQNDAIIYRVYRNSEDGVTRVSEPYFRKDLDHLMLNSLLTSPLFGLSDSRLDSGNDFADTSEDFLMSRIHKKVSLKLQEQKKAGKEFISDQEIDDLIQGILDEELSEDNDQG